MSSRFLPVFFIAVLIGLILQFSSFSQETTDKRQNLSMLYPTYSINLPSFDMKDRFGISHSIGAGYSFMFKNKWIMNVEGTFLFGNDIKNSGDILRIIATGDGHIISQSGTYSQVALSERGYSFWLKTGKLFPLGKPEKNSGLLLMTGAGMIQHKIRIDVADNSAPQLRNDYKKGYDRMCNGPALSEFIGYQYLSEAKRINFFAGLEFTLAWTQSRRAYYYSEMIKPSENRFDMLTGLKIGWVIPFYGKSNHEYYYY